MARPASRQREIYRALDYTTLTLVSAADELTAEMRLAVCLAGHDSGNPRKPESSAQTFFMLPCQGSAQVFGLSSDNGQSPRECVRLSDLSRHATYPRGHDHQYPGRWAIAPACATPALYRRFSHLSFPATPPRYIEPCHVRKRFFCCRVT